MSSLPSTVSPNNLPSQEEETFLVVIEGDNEGQVIPEQEPLPEGTPNHKRKKEGSVIIEDHYTNLLKSASRMREDRLSLLQGYEELKRKLEQCQKEREDLALQVQEKEQALSIKDKNLTVIRGRVDRRDEKIRLLEQKIKVRDTKLSSLEDAHVKVKSARNLVRRLKSEVESRREKSKHDNYYYRWMSTQLDDVLCNM